MLRKLILVAAIMLTLITLEKAVRAGWLIYSHGGVGAFITVITNDAGTKILTNDAGTKILIPQ